MLCTLCFFGGWQGKAASPGSAGPLGRLDGYRGVKRAKGRTRSAFAGRERTMVTGRDILPNKPACGQVAAGTISAYRPLPHSCCEACKSHLLLAYV